MTCLQQRCLLFPLPLHESSTSVHEFSVGGSCTPCHLGNPTRKSPKSSDLLTWVPSSVFPLLITLAKKCLTAERATPSEEVTGSIPSVAARSLLVGSVSV